MKDKPTYIVINSGKINIAFYVYYKAEENGMVSSYIPAYNIYYSSPSMEEAKRRPLIMVRSFYKYWLNNEGWKNFVLEIRKLGFLASNTGTDFAFKNLLNGRPDKVKFSTPYNTVPEGYNDVEEYETDLAA